MSTTKYRAWYLRVWWIGATGLTKMLLGNEPRRTLGPVNQATDAYLVLYRYYINSIMNSKAYHRNEYSNIHDASLPTVAWKKNQDLRTECNRLYEGIRYKDKELTI